MKAARLLAERVEGLKVGTFHLTKRLPVAAGIGGGSSDAAAALRLLARLNGLPLSHPALREAARLTGADVPVCLEPRARMMRGAGEELGPALDLPRLFAVLVNPARAGRDTRRVQGAGTAAGAGAVSQRASRSWGRLAGLALHSVLKANPQRPGAASAAGSSH